MPSRIRIAAPSTAACGAVSRSANRAAQTGVESEHFRDMFWRSGGAAAVHPDRLRRADGRRRARHGVRPDLEHAPDQHRACRRPPRRPGVHTAETFTTAVSGISHVAHRNVDWRLFFRIVIPGVIGGVTRRLCADAGRCAETAKPLVLAYLTALGALSLLSRRDAPPHRAAAEDRRAARPGRRLPRRRRRRRLGRDRHLQPAGPGQQPAQDHRHRQHRRILPDGHDLGDLPRRRCGWEAFTIATARAADRRRRSRRRSARGSPSASIPTCC